MALFFVNNFEKGQVSAFNRSVDLMWIYVQLYKQGMRLSDLYINNNVAYIKMENGFKKNQTNQYAIFDKEISGENQMLLFPLSGLGDYFIFHSLICEFVKKSKREVVIPIIGGIPSMNLNFYYPSLKKIYFDNDMTFLFFRKLKFRNAILMSDMFSDYFNRFNTKEHIFDIAKKILKTDVEPYKYRKEIISIFRKQTIAKKDEIDRVGGRIGVQLTASLINDKLNVVAYERSMSEEFIRKLDKLCYEKNYQLVSLSPLPYDGLFMDKLSSLSTEDYIYAVSKMSLVIGIDSSAGHIASFFNIPNLTIWKKHAFQPNATYRRSYRPLSNNISIYSDEIKFDKLVTPEAVVRVLDRYMRGCFDLRESLYNTLYNTVYIESRRE